MPQLVRRSGERGRARTEATREHADRGDHGARHRARPPSHERRDRRCATSRPSWPAGYVHAGEPGCRPLGPTPPPVIGPEAARLVEHRFGDAMLRQRRCPPLRRPRRRRGRARSGGPVRPAPAHVRRCAADGGRPRVGPGGPSLLWWPEPRSSAGRPAWPAGSAALHYLSGDFEAALDALDRRDASPDGPDGGRGLTALAALRLEPTGTDADVVDWLACRAHVLAMLGRPMPARATAAACSGAGRAARGRTLPLGVAHLAAARTCRGSLQDAHDDQALRYAAQADDAVTVARALAARTWPGSGRGPL